MEEMKYAVIIQARIGSTRLPAKVLKDLCGKPVLEHELERIKQAKKIDGIIVATTDNENNQPIIDIANKQNINYFKGSENDVLARYYYAAKEYNVENIIRITADCPLIDPHLIDEMIDVYEENACDIITNVPDDNSQMTYPRGLDVEIFRTTLLKEAFDKAESKYDREHVTPYIYKNTDKIYVYKYNKDYSNYRWTLDTPEDYELIQKIYQGLYHGEHNFYFNDIIRYIENNKELLRINDNVVQKGAHTYHKNQKRVMILGANNFLLPLIKCAKKLDMYTIVASPDENEPGFAYADERVYVDLRDKKKVYEIAKNLHLDGIITDQAETPVKTVAYVADKLNLPGIGNDKAELFTNKFLMRETCRKIGIDTIKYRLVDNLEDAVSFYKTLDTDAIMKPIDSAGSRGVVRIDKVETIIENFEYTKNSSKTGNVIIEEYIEGKELLLDGVVFNGIYQTIICGEYIKCEVPGVFSEYMGKYPAEIAPEQYEMVNKLVKKIVEGFELPWGRTHTEVKINDRGAWLMETAARGGGRYISSGIVPLMTDFSSEEFLLKACTGQLTQMPTINPKNVSAGYVAFFLPKGEVISIDGLQEAIDLPYTGSNNFEDIKVGLKTCEFKDKIEGKFIHLVAKDDEELYQRVDDIEKTIKIKVKTEDGIEGPIWKTV